MDDEPLSTSAAPRWLAALVLVALLAAAGHTTCHVLSLPAIEDAVEETVGEAADAPDAAGPGDARSERP